MRNVWKGFVIGSVAGAVIGLVLDGGSKASERIGEAASNVDFSAKASDLGAKASELRDRAAKSDVVNLATDRAQDAVRTGTDALSHAKEAVSDIAAKHSPSS